MVDKFEFYINIVYFGFYATYIEMIEISDNEELDLIVPTSGPGFSSISHDVSKFEMQTACLLLY